MTVIESTGIALEELYQDLHRNPELAFGEYRTAGIIADRLRVLGLDVITGIAGTGVVGILTNGDGPTVMLRADMDALPVEEDTGLSYASVADGTSVPLMHACGHDVHVTCLIGATEELVASRADWSGTVLALFQPAEEGGGGANAMVQDGLYDRIPRPDIVLGQHVSPFPAGWVGAHPGPAMAAADHLDVRMIGRGGHGSEPETTIDPVVMLAATVMRLQTVVAREIGAHETAVVSVGSINAGTKSNIIPSFGTLGITIRSFSEVVRGRLLGSVERIIKAEALASGASVEPEISHGQSYPVTLNDPEATVRLTEAFVRAFGKERTFDPGAIAGSEDVGVLATAAGVPLVYWMLGGCDAADYAAAEEAGTLRSDVPSNHSPTYAPVMQPTIGAGVDALVVAAREWLTSR